MKTKMNIRSIILVATICLASMFFINICFAANTGKVTVEMTRLREEPSTDSKVLETIPSSEQVEILEEVQDWFKVKYKGITGYIRKDLLQSENNDEEQATEANAATDEDKTIEANATAEEKTIEKGKYKIAKDIKLKITPLISSIEMYEVKKDQEVEVIEIINDWTKVTTSDVKQGWIRVENLSPIETSTTQDNQQQVEQKQEETKTEQPQNNTKTMYINVETANVRQKADKSSKIIKQLSINTKVEVKSTENGWCLIEIEGTNGYIAESLLSTTKTETSRSATAKRSETANTSTTKTQESTNTNNQTSTSNLPNNSNKTNTTKQEETTTSTTGSAVVEYAKKFLGCKYVYGGTTTSGFDCSGFTQFVYKNFGITLNRTAAAQYSNGKSVTNLQAGDLVMFGKSGINHVGIYIGGNSFIHAANQTRGVTIDTLSSGYYKTNYVGARRVL